MVDAGRSALAAGEFELADASVAGDDAAACGWPVARHWAAGAWREFVRWAAGAVCDELGAAGFCADIHASAVRAMSSAWAIAALTASRRSSRRS